MCTALTAICKLVSIDAMGALIPQITALITHPRDVVRKKVVMALHKLYILDPRAEGPLAGVDIDRLVRQALCDKVMNITHGQELMTSAKSRVSMNLEASSRICLHSYATSIVFFRILLLWLQQHAHCTIWPNLTQNLSGI